MPLPQALISEDLHLSTMLLQFLFLILLTSLQVDARPQFMMYPGMYGIGMRPYGMMYPMYGMRPMGMMGMRPYNPVGGAIRGAVVGSLLGAAVGR